MASVMRQPATDDRAQAYQPVVLAEMARRAEGAETRAAARMLQQTLKRVVKEETRRWSIERFLVGIGLALGLVFTIVVVLFLLGSVLGGLPALLVFVGAIVGVTFVDQAVARRRIGAAIGSTIAAHGFCARCGYSLRGLEPADDGCLPCPECGGCWYEDRLTRPHWDSPKRPLAPKPSLVMRLRALKPPMVADSRGMLCRRVDSWLLTPGRARRAELGPDRIRAVIRAIRAPSAWIRIAISVLLGGALAWLLFNRPHPDADDTEALWVLWSAGFFITAISLFTTLNGELGIRSRTLAAACTAHDLCASCTADLPEPGPTGFRVCPTCGASWRAAS